MTGDDHERRPTGLAPVSNGPHPVEEMATQCRISSEKTDRNEQNGICLQPRGDANPDSRFFSENVLFFLLSGLTLTSMTSCAHSGDGVAVCRSWGLRPRRVTASIMSCCRCHSECPPLLAASAEDSLSVYCCRVSAGRNFIRGSVAQKEVVSCFFFFQMKLSLICSPLKNV